MEIPMKSHKPEIVWLKKDIKGQNHVPIFNCPVNGCKYSINSGRFFRAKKNLDQHIVKVHSEKKFVCSKCPKYFGSDWLREYHERTCGILECGTCMSRCSSRESLLTHCRRSGHEVPEPLRTKKLKQADAQSMKTSQNTIIIIQTVVPSLVSLQMPANMQVLETSERKLRPILANPVYTFPAYTSTAQTTDSAPSQITAACNMPCDDSDKAFSVKSTKPEMISKSVQTHSQSVATQTTSNYSSSKSRESRGSQCSRRRTKASKVNSIESTHTQTAESAVTRRRKSRRKSIGITTDSSLPNSDTFWPNFKDLICLENFKVEKIEQDSLDYFINDPGKSQHVNSNSIDFNIPPKIPLNENTIEDHHGLENIKVEKIEQDSLDYFINDAGKSQHVNSNHINFNIPPKIPLCGNTIKGHHGNNNLNLLNILTDVSSIGHHNFDDKSTINIDGVFKDSSDFQHSPSSMFQNFDAGIQRTKFDTHTQTILPEYQMQEFADIHTQTMTTTIFDDCDLANNATQTTDFLDIGLFDLDMSDSETQTQCEDLLGIEDPSLPVDQFSLGIQTDFSLDTFIKQEPYDFLSIDA